MATTPPRAPAAAWIAESLGMMLAEGMVGEGEEEGE